MWMILLHVNLNADDDDDDDDDDDELLTACRNLFLNMNDARETANSSFIGITCVSEKISRCC